MISNQDPITTLTTFMSQLSLAPPKPQRTSFLTLPSEIRQAILIDTFTPQPLSSQDTNIEHTGLWVWADTLRQVHADIKHSVNYVERKWEEEAERLEKAVCSWKKTRDEVDKVVKGMTWPASRKWCDGAGPSGIKIKWNDTLCKWLRS